MTKACTNLSVFILVYFIAEEDDVTDVVVVVTVVVVTVQIRLKSSLSKDYKLQLLYHFKEVKLKCRSFERGKSIFRCCLFFLAEATVLVQQSPISNRESPTTPPRVRSNAIRGKCGTRQSLKLFAQVCSAMT